MEFKNFLIIKRNVKYPRIELKGKPTIILPYGNEFKPEEIIEKHKDWIEKKIRFIENIKKKYAKSKIYERSKEELKSLVQNFIEKYSKKLGVEVKKVIYRDMNSKWASCRKNGRLTFNLKMKYLPEKLIKYIVYHELVHILFPDHKSNFWQYIKKEFKNPQVYEEMLYGYWFIIK